MPQWWWSALSSFRKPRMHRSKRLARRYSNVCAPSDAPQSRTTVMKRPAAGCQAPELPRSGPSKNPGQWAPENPSAATPRPADTRVRCEVNHRRRAPIVGVQPPVAARRRKPRASCRPRPTTGACAPLRRRGRRGASPRRALTAPPSRVVTSTPGVARMRSCGAVGSDAGAP